MQAQFNQAQSLHQAGHFQQAEALYRELLNDQPEHPLLNARLGLLLHQTQRNSGALVLLSKAIEMLPNEFELLMQGVGVATQLADHETAEKWLKKALLIKPDDIQANEQLAGVLVGNHKESEALGIAKKVIRLDPKNANGYNLKGLALSRLGDTDKGYKAFQKALRLNPGQLAVIRNLILYGKNKKEPLLEQLIPQLEERVMQKNLPAMVKMNMAYVLSMYFEKRKASEKSFRYLKLGNDTNRAGYAYQHSDTQRQFGELAKRFNQDLKTAFGNKGLTDGSAIFILGMPRSGTTLVEQVLSSHSQVEAEGEIQDLKNSVDMNGVIGVADMSHEQTVARCLKAANQYLECVRARQSASYFTDKMPYNFMLIGLIALAMPNAKIIHCTRDPLETCFSIYKQNFSGSHSYTNELRELGQYYNVYQSLMAHWNALFGEKIYALNYEKMIDNSEREIAALLEFCGLEMESKCLEFHKNKRAVRTASVAQVRQPIYRDAMKASAPYQKALQPLISVLESGEGSAFI